MASAPPVARAGVVLVSIALAHGTVDAYAAFLHPLLPRIMVKLGLSITLAATLVMSLSLAAALLQPAMGYLADRYGRRVLLALGPVLTGIFLPLMGRAPTFGILVLFLVLGGLGAAVFHPPGAALAARASGGKGSGLRLSIFSFGGTTGFALGPLIAVSLVAAFGLEGIWIAMVPGVLIGLGLAALLRGTNGRPTGGLPPHPLRLLAALKGPLGIVFGISAVGAFVQRTFLTMEPIIASRAGVSEATGAAVLSVYLGAQALGTLTSGVLTDRMDRRRVLVVATALGVPAHILAVTLAPASTWALVAAVAAGFLNMAILPPVVVMAQEMIPEGTAVSSGIVMGLAWATGSVGILAAGALGDAVGPVAAAAYAMPMMLGGTALALHPSLKPYSHGSWHARYQAGS